MKYHKSIFLLLIAPFFLSGSIKKNRQLRLVTEDKWSRNISSGADFLLPADISIADTRIVEGNSGQRSVEVIVSISLVTPGPVTVAYSTRDGSAVASSDYDAANGSVNFAPGELMKKITISINGDVTVEADEKFEVVLSNPAGATLADSIGTVTIVNDDLSGNFSVYEVRFTYTGYTSFHGTPSDCPIRPNGTVVLNGLLTGAENVASDGDIYYTGILQMDMDIDICSASQGLSGDDTKNCGITVIGSGPMKTELKINFDQRGGYIKTWNESGGFMKNVSGSCDKGQMDEELNMVPNETIASVFNGTDLPMLTNRTLRVGRYVVSAAEGELVVEVLRKVR